MISFLAGKVAYLGDRYAIVDVGGVGYKAYISEKTLNSLSGNSGEVNPKKVKFFTHTVFNTHDGQLDIYGFLKPEELYFFELLISVSGIGPKKALIIISNVEFDKLQLAVIKGDYDYLAKVASLGAKTAARLILELKGRFKPAKRSKFDLGTESEALEALVSLGYSKNQVLEALKKVKNTKDTETTVKETLKVLSEK